MIKEIYGGIMLMLIIFLMMYTSLASLKIDLKDKESLPNQKHMDSIPKFSIEKHYKKLEQVTKEIVQSRKNDYTIILWLLDDGLRINEDGSTVWIKRWIEKTPYLSEHIRYTDLINGWTEEYQAKVIMSSLNASHDALRNFKYCGITTDMEDYFNG